MLETVYERVDGAVGWIVINNPSKRNAMSLDMCQRLLQSVENFSRQTEIRVIAITGEGSEAFISGADISEFGALRTSPEAIRQYDRVAIRAQERLRQASKPTVAVIEGHCIGGGVGLALECDLRICSDDAQFAIPAAKLGVGYHEYGIRKLASIVGPASAKEMFFTARRYPAEDALRLGLVNRVIPKQSFREVATAYCAELAKNAPLTIRSVKKTVDALYPGDAKLSDDVYASIDACSTSDDYKEGQLAFREKRAPVFNGT